MTLGTISFDANIINRSSVSQIFRLNSKDLIRTGLICYIFLLVISPLGK